MNNTNDDDNDGFMESLDPALIHKVLLTDPAEFSTLSSSNSNPSTRFTLPFEEFQECLGDGSSTGLQVMDRDMVMKKAVRDHIAQTLTQQPDNLAPLSFLLCELNQNVRDLIPNRKELHSILDDDEAKAATTIDELKPLILKAATSLARLESESRSTTTLELLKQLQQPSESEDDNNQKDAKFWVTVIFYLIYKTELCQADKQDFYLVNVWAPRISKDGPALEKSLYQTKFGEFSDPEGSPATRQWIQSLVHPQIAANPQDQPHQSQESVPVSLLESTEERKALVRAGWIEDIVFRGPDQKKELILPEIFAQDRNGLQTLREMSRLAVAGCALALQACGSAGVDSNKVLTNPDCTSKERRMALLQSLRNRSMPAELYEKNVTEQVMALADEWSTNYGTHKEINEESLQGRVVAVLRGHDPVLQLLDNRTKKAVRDVLLNGLHTGSSDHLIMRTGTSRQLQSSDSSERSSKTEADDQTVVGKLFCQRGLAFFSSELAVVSKLAGKVVDLAIGLYWDDLLDKTVLDECVSQQERLGTTETRPAKEVEKGPSHEAVCS